MTHGSRESTAVQVALKTNEATVVRNNVLLGTCGADYSLISANSPHLHISHREVGALDVTIRTIRT